MFSFECCSEFNIATAFYTSTADKIIAFSAVFKSFGIKRIIAFFIGLDFVYILLNQFVIFIISALKQKTSLAFTKFHYLSTMNLTTLQGGIFAIKPSDVSSKSLNSAGFTFSLFSNVL